MVEAVQRGERRVGRRVAFEIASSTRSPDGSHEGPVADEVLGRYISDALVEGGRALEQMI